MRWRGLFFISLGLNLVAVALWLFLPGQRQNNATEQTALDSAPTAVQTNYVVRRQFFAWSQIESDDYPTYIANLRGIKCPEQTIRDIIIADVNALFTRRLATEVVTPAQQWWRSEPDPEVVRAAGAKVRALENERRALLTRLLGTNWESGDLANLPRPSHPGITLDGPVLGTLSAEAQQKIQDISARAQERLQVYLQSQAQAGRQADPAELARLRQETRNQLARALTPQQLEEYLLRYSQNANELRNQFGQLEYFNPSPEEFRAVFRAVDLIDQQLGVLPAGDDPHTVNVRNDLLQRRENAIKIALGPERYQEFLLLHDPVYVGSVASAQQAGDPNAAPVLYQINLATAQEQESIRANTNLTPEQMAVELRRAALEQAKASVEALGQEVPPEPQAPVTNPPPPAPRIRSHPYVVGVGESVATIATVFGVPVERIQAANPNLDLRRLNPGDRIQVPYR